MVQPQALPAVGRGAFTLKPPGGSGNQCTPIWHTHGGLINQARGRDTLVHASGVRETRGGLVGV